MKNKSLVLFVAIFLVIIYTVPVLQTANEFFTNDKHHVQIADLIEDLFVTPYKKAVTARKMLDSITVSLDAVYNRMGDNTAQAQDSAPICDATLFVDRTDEALINVRSLMQGVIDYNRHITGEKNRFAEKDTLAPYYRELQKLEGLLDTCTKMMQQGEPCDTLLPPDYCSTCCD